MKVYCVKANINGISFTKHVSAISITDAKNKIEIEEKKQFNRLSYFTPDIKIESIFRRY